MSSPPTGSSPGTDASGSESAACAYTDYESGDAPAEYPKTGEGATGTEAEVWDALSEVEDPEMPVSIVDLGLIYDVDVEGERAEVEMTLTYTGCPAKDMLTNDVRCAALTASGVHEADVSIKYSPPWSVDMVTERGKDQLREFGLSV
ncbi:1,2-phenylacetyl-CoA epoxidase subunit PaaD [Halobacterium zhouii]|uniref:1,2-phenylacetyl-CoA epoxidase subunit PaaD n=1 Tax=Halobacterium zhouii TaxID=2902624 RepID=UPI001E537EDE|nr:1,2-phenylacetyl-CoA epoxidase subunit PaaD [Halobacterium zhouii]